MYKTFEKSLDQQSETQSHVTFISLARFKPELSQTALHQIHRYTKSPKTQIISVIIRKGEIGAF